MMQTHDNNTPSRFSKWLPTPGNVIFTLLMIAALVWVQSTGAFPAPAPKAETAATSTGTIAYQGRLADANGNPLTDTYPMVFRLYNAPGVGAYPLWEENWTGSNSVQVSDGLFNVMLGTLTPISQTIVTENSTLWLGISVSNDDEMTPRVQLGSVPFAVQANTVLNGSITTEKLVDGAVTQAKLGADVNLVPPDGSITTVKLADGAVTSAKRTIATYHAKHAADIMLVGQTTKTLSQFQFNDVPPGDVFIIVTLTANKLDSSTTSNYGAINLESPAGTRLNRIGTHGITGAWEDTYITLHGHIQDFAGGTLTVRVTAEGEDQNTNLRFGHGTDSRFARHITVIAGQ